MLAGVECQTCGALGLRQIPAHRDPERLAWKAQGNLWTFVDTGKCLSQQFLSCLTFCGCGNGNAEHAPEGRAGVSLKERCLCGFGNANFLFRVLSQCLLLKMGRPLAMKLKFHSKCKNQNGS